MKRILILGAGGREHALAWKLSKSKKVETLFYGASMVGDMLPNPAMKQIATYVNLDIANPQQVIEFCHKEKIDFVVVGPEAPIVAGVCDALALEGILHFGPSKKAGQIESSKSFTKDICQKLNVPTAAYKTCFTELEAIEALTKFSLPVVIKADGLAAGKGVVIAQTSQEANETVKEMFSGLFGEASEKIVLESFLTGEEASFFVLCDGENIVPLTSAQDHKRAFDGDTGPNTGGMGAYSPAPIMNELVTQKTIDEIIKPIVSYMKEQNMPYKGVLYAGLMIENNQPFLIEFNARFGDPECQVLMQRLESDVLDLLVGCATSFDNMPLPIWSENSAITVVMVAEGYPQTPKKGCEIKLPKVQDGAMIFHAGTATKDDKIFSVGGRVLNVTSKAKDLKTAKEQAYNLIQNIDFKDGFYRKDIGDKAL